MCVVKVVSLTAAGGSSWTSLCSSDRSSSLLLCRATPVDADTGLMPSLSMLISERASNTAEIECFLYTKLRISGITSISFTRISTLCAFFLQLPAALCTRRRRRRRSARRIARPFHRRFRRFCSLEHRPMMPAWDSCHH